MGNPHSLVSNEVARHGAAYVARLLDVSRAALVSYLAGAARDATRIVIEQRAARLEPAPGPVPGDAA